MIFDTHAHYDDEAFSEDRDKLLSELFSGPIGHIVDVAASYDSLSEIPKLLLRYPKMYAAYGLHPTELTGLDMEETLSKVHALLQTERAVALGEIGLDYYWDTKEKELQQKWFLAQLSLAAELQKPVIIHSREACEDTFSLMKPYFNKVTGVIHCYSYSAEMALEYIKRDFYIGVGGVVTYKNGRRLKETVEAIPLERIVIETDSPYLPPVPFRGERNHSGNLTKVVEEIARIKGLTPEEVEMATYQNALNLYHIEERN